MSNRGIAVVGVRLLAIYVLLRLLFLLPHALTQWLDPNRPNTMSAVMFLAGIAVAAYLWFRVGTIVGWMLPSRTAQSVAAEGSAGDSLPAHLIFAGAGALLLAWSLPELLGQAFGFYRTFDPPLDLDAAAPALSAVAVSGLRVLLGLAMMLGSGGIARAIHHLRRTGAG